jgi:hypothetical protein
MYIEDLILRTAANGRWLWETPFKLSTNFEDNFIQSIANQIERGDALTEKQAGFALKLLHKVEPDLITFFKKKTWDLNNPSYKKPFRALSPVMSVELDRSAVPGKIIVRFPYIENIVKDIKDYKNVKGYGTAEWSPDFKAWIFSLTEDNIKFIDKAIVPKGFKADDEFKEYVAQIEKIENNLENIVPMVVLEDGIPKFKNTHNSVPQPETDDAIEVCLLARKYGINVFDDKLNAIIHDENTCLVTRAVLEHSNKLQPLWIDRELVPITEFKDIVKHAQPLLFVVPGGSEYEHLSNWHIFLKSQGIEDKEISVMFRLPNEGKGDFNIYVKDNNLNNEITENTKAIFVSVKIPKPLVKANVKFNAIINLGYNFNTHYTMDTMLHSSHTLIFYTETQPKVKSYGYR